MLDVVVTVSESTPMEWVDECLASIAEAARVAPFKVTAITVPGVPGHIGQAMSNGLAAVTAEYMCWVDDDDYVLPHAFSCLAPALDAKAPVICAREVELYANGYREKCNARHHLTAYQTSWVRQHDLTPFRSIPGVALLKRFPENTVDVLEWVYMRRVRISDGMRLRGQYLQEEALLCR